MKSPQIALVVCLLWVAANPVIAQTTLSELWSDAAQKGAVFQADGELDTSTNLPLYKNVSYLENGRLAREETIKITGFNTENSSLSFCFEDLNAPENAPRIGRGPPLPKRKYVPFTPSTPGETESKK